MPALHGWHGEDRSDRWDENGDILDDEDGNDDQHNLEIASWYTWTEHDGNDNDDNVQSTKPVIIELNLFHLGRGALVDWGWTMPSDSTCIPTNQPIDSFTNQPIASVTNQ